MDDLLKSGTFGITPKVLRNIGQINEFKEVWAALRCLASERLDRLRRVDTTKSIGSDPF